MMCKILTLVFILVISNAQSQCLNSAHYAFSGNANDISINGFHGSVSGATLSTNRFGIPNTAYDFDGVSDYIDLPTDFDFPQRTINVWFKADTTTTTATHIYDSDNPGMQNASTKMWVWTNGGVPKVGMSTGNNQVNQHNEPINLNQWYMGTIVVSSSDVKFYLNAQLISTGVINPGVATSGHSTALIGASRLIDRFFDGTIDDVGIFDCALNQQSIDSLFNYSPEDCLVGRYFFDNNADDISGNFYNGNPNNPTLTTNRFNVANSAYDFDGVSDYIDLPTDFDYPQRTINAWFKVDNTTTNPAHIYDSDNPGMQNASTKMWVWTNGGVPKVGMSTGNNQVNQHNEPINLNQWYMGSITVGASDVKFYLNGQLISTGAINSGVATTGHSTALIGASRLIDRFFDGKIDDVSIYNCELSASTIDSLYGNFTSVEELNENHLNIYPNPTSNIINIELPKYLNKVSYEIFDAVGKLIVSSKLVGNNISVSNLSNGIYFLNIEVNGIVYKQKFIKN